MPALLTPIIQAIGTFAAFGGPTGFIVANAAAIAQGIMLVGGLAYSNAQAKKAKRKAREAYNAQQVDRLANVTSTIAPRELVLGRVRKGGTVFFKASTGTNLTTFLMAVALAGHEVDAVETLYLNDEPVTVDGSGNVTSAPYSTTQLVSAGVYYDAAGTYTLPHTPEPTSMSVYVTSPGETGGTDAVGYTLTGNSITLDGAANVSYQYPVTTSRCNVRYVLGTDTQTADARMMELFPDLWTADHRAQGVAYAIVECTYDETAFPNGLPAVTVVMRGAKCYDPRENRITYSQAFDDASWTALGAKNVAASAFAAPDGTLTAFTVSDVSGAAYQGIQKYLAIPNDSEVHTTRIYVRKTTGGTAPTLGINLLLSNGTNVNSNARLNSDTGAVVFSGSGPSGSVTDAGQYWLLTVKIQNNSTGNTAGYLQIYPSTSAYGGGVSDTVTATGSATVWGAQWIFGSVEKRYTPTTATAKVPTTAWTQNPALHMRYVYAHPDFGKATVTQDEDDRFIAAADACEEQQGYTVNGVTTPVNRYRSALVVPFGAAASDVFDDLAQAMAGSWAFAGGQLYVKAGKFTPSIMSLTQEDLATVTMSGDSLSQNQIVLVPHQERVSKFNTVDLTIWDKAQDYKQVQLTPLTSEALKARDGVELVQQVTMAAVFHAPQAQHIAGIMMREARDPLTVKIPVKLKAYPLELFDVIDLTVPRYGWTSKLFQVVGREWSSDGMLVLTLKETTAANFDADSSFLPQGYAANTSLPSPWYVPTIGTLTVSSGTSELHVNNDGTVVSRMRVMWPTLDNATILSAGTVEVQYRRFDSNGEWTTVSVSGTENQVVISDVQDGVAYVIRARARNKLAVGLWNVQASHIVIGKTEPPSAPASVSLTQTQVYATKVSDVDVAGYLVRAIAASSAVATDWSRATPLHTGVVTDFPWTNPVRLYGVQTVMVAAVDTSGNVGLPTMASLDFGLADSSNAIQTTNYRNLLWPGSYTNCSVSGDLIADSNPSSDIYILPELYGEPDVYATNFLGMSWVSTPFVPAYGGGLLTLDYVTSGPSVTVEYTIDGDTEVDLYSSPDEYAVTNLYGVSAAYRPWPGALSVGRMQGVVFRVSIGAGGVQGKVEEFIASLTLSEATQSFGETAISSAGTRFAPSAGSPARTWVVIKSVNVTPVVDGSGAVSGRVLEYPPNLGPLVQLVNSAGTAVNSRALVTVGGFVDV